MSKLLNIQASPRGERSYSISVTDAFIKSYRQANPADEIVTLNLFTKELPPFDGLVLQAKYTFLHGLEHTEKELAAWRSMAPRKSSTCSGMISKFTVTTYMESLLLL